MCRNCCSSLTGHIPGTKQGAVSPNDVSNVSILFLVVVVVLALSHDHTLSVVRGHKTDYSNRLIVEGEEYTNVKINQNNEENCTQQ